MTVFKNKLFVAGALYAATMSGAPLAAQLCTQTPIPRQGEVPINVEKCLTNYGHYLEFNVPYNNSNVTITTSGGTYSGTLDADLILYTGNNWNADEIESQTDNADSNDESLSFVSRSGIRKFKINGNITQTNLFISVTGGDVPPPLGDYVVFDTNVQVNLPAPALSSKSQFHQSVKDLLTASSYSDYFKANADPIDHISEALHFVASADDISDTDVKNLLYIVGAYSSFSNDNRNTNATPITDAQAAKLSIAMQAIAKMTDFHSTASPAGKVHSAYNNAMGIFNKGHGASHFAEQLPHILALVQYYSSLSKPFTFDGFGDSVKYAVKLISIGAEYGDSAVADALNANMIDVLSVLRSFALLGETAYDGSYTTELDRSWIIHTSFDTLAQVAKVANPEANDRINSMMVEIYNKLTTVLSTEITGALVNYTFLKELNRTCNSSDALGNYCKSEDDILSVTRECTSAYTIRAQSGVTQAQLATSCDEIADQETIFHQQFNTSANSPVADDNNSTLDIVLFANPDEYKKLAGLMYGVSTDNGGIYLEGSPEVVGNQARFIAKVCADDWVGGSCEYIGQFYNLRHELTHYLDGRYNKYGKYKYRKYDTAWSEGMAEYLAQGNNYPRTIKGTKGKVIPPFYNIMMMDYGYEDLYQWGYFAMHYLVNQYPSEVTTLAQAMRSSDAVAYEATIKAVIERTQAGFEAYVVANSEAVASNVEVIPAANTIGSCDLVQQYVAKVDAPKVSGVFTNTTGTPVSLMWLNKNTGKYVGSKIYKTLNQGESYTLTNWREDDRVVLSDNNYNCLGVAVLGTGQNNYSIDAQVVANAKQETFPAIDTLGSCDLMDRHIKDENGTGAFSITNTTNYPVTVMRIDDTTGKPLFASQYGTLKQGETFSQTNWYKNRRVMLADARLNCLAVGVLNNDSTDYTIDASTIANAAPVEVLPPANTIGSCDLIQKHFIDTVGYPMSITNNSDKAIRVYRVLNETGEVNYDTIYATLQPGESYVKDAAKAWYGKRRAVLATESNQCVGVAIFSEKDSVNTFSITQDLIPDGGGTGGTDTDGDGVVDTEDAFPNDPTETKDTDGDGVGDNADAFPNDALETTDSDGDLVGDNADAFPNDASESADANNNGVGDNKDVQNAARYCTQSGGSQGYEWITGVSLNGVNKTSGKENGGYSDFTNATINLTGGSSADLVLTTNNTSDNEYWYVWIDFNNDGDFADANEAVFAGRSSNSATTTTSIAIPAGLNVATRMRVAVSYRSIADACATIGYGEVEDYSIKISSDGNSNVKPVANANGPYTDVENASIAFSSAGSSDSDGTITAYEWNFGDNTANSTQANPTHIYTAPGTYTVTLTVTDDKGATTSTTATVTVAPQGGGTSDVIDACATQATRSNGRLEDGEAVCLASGSNMGFSIADVSGHTSMAITTAHGTGDIKLRYNNGSWPGSSNNDGQSDNANSNSECIYITNQSEYWGYLIVDGSSGGTTVVVDFDTAGCR